MLLALNKPYGVLCKFMPEPGRPTLADFIRIPRVYPAGRLDHDSEGLLLLTDDGHLQATLSSPAFKLEKTYWVQVDGTPTEAQLTQLSEGVRLKDGLTRPALAQAMPEPDGLWHRDPHIRVRLNQPTNWIELRIREGRNRQVRRMTAAVGLPTLRLIRYAIGHHTLDGLPLGQWEAVNPS